MNEGAQVTQFSHLDFSQISSDQAKLLRVWYWLVIFSRRYSSAAQTYAEEDAQALERLGKGDFSGILSVIQRTQSLIRNVDDLFVIHKKYDAVYKGVLNLINFHTGGFLNLQNGNPVSMANNLEDHHIFPNDYLKKNWAQVHETLDSEIAIDCVVNRTLIPKLTNIRVSNKPPSQYLNEIRGENSNIGHALSAHLISEGLLTGEYDKMYDYFLQERADAILAAVQKHVSEARIEVLKQFGAI